MERDGELKSILNVCGVQEVLYTILYLYTIVLARVLFLELLLKHVRGIFVFL